MNQEMLQLLAFLMQNGGGAMAQAGDSAGSGGAPPWSPFLKPGFDIDGAGHTSFPTIPVPRGTQPYPQNPARYTPQDSAFWDFLVRGPDQAGRPR